MCSSHPRLQPGEAFDPAGAAVLQLVAARLKPLLHRNRDPELNRVTNERTEKTFRSYADDGVRQPVQHLATANHIWVGIESLAPELIADNGDGVRIASEILFGQEPSAQNRMNPQRLEVVCRNHGTGRPLGTVADAESGCHQTVRNKAIDQFGALLVIQEVGPGNGRCARSAPRGAA